LPHIPIYWHVSIKKINIWRYDTKTREIFLE
jgi:hypothetical protein